MASESITASDVEQYFPDYGNTDHGEFAKQVLAEAKGHTLTLVSVNRLPPDVLRKWVYPIVNAYQNFETAFDDAIRPPRPWKNKLGTLNLSTPPRPWAVSEDALHCAANAYFEGPLRSRTLDRALVDALLYRAILDFLDNRAGLPAAFVPAAFYSVFILVVGFFSMDGNWWKLLALSAAPPLLFFLAWAFPRYGHLSRYLQLKAAYRRLASGPASASDVSRLLQKVEGSVDLPPQLFAILDDVTARGSTL
jgi:hypothetical protein